MLTDVFLLHKAPSSAGLHLDTGAGVRESKIGSSGVGVCVVGAAGPL